MAHELSHIVLHSLWHREKNNEIYTDLTAMVLGFAEVMQQGRKVVETRHGYSSTETTATRFGYLSDEQFRFAFNQLRTILENNAASFNQLRAKSLQKLTTYKTLLDSYKRRLYQFKNYIKYLDNNRKRRIRKEHVQRIIEFHDLGYSERFASVLRNNEGKLKGIDESWSDWLKHSHHYTSQRVDSMRVFYENLNTLVSDFAKESNLLNSDVTMLRQNVGFFCRRKVERQIRSME
jgi:hypothetical protein